jgi:general stress protein 26
MHRGFLEHLARLARSVGQRRTRELSVALVLDVARRTMRRKRYCVIVTQGPTAPHARVVQPYHPDPDFVVWMGTSGWSRKTAEICRDASTTLVYEDDARATCVTLIGTATIEPDGRKFMPFWLAFWPDGPADESFVNIRFVPERIEVWSAAAGVTPPPYGLVSAHVVRQGGDWVLSPGERVPAASGRS